MPNRFFEFLDGLDRDLREELIERLRVVWTHSSTALEGNTLTEGETYGVLKFGLTVGGKPLAHHTEVTGHARAIDLLFDLCREGRDLTLDDVRRMHVAVQNELVVDIYAPVGAWKVEPNSTLVRIGDKTLINDTYALPDDVPALMNDWLTLFKDEVRSGGIEAYARIHAAFARIHPFADGNGRLARLLANVPLLLDGLPPVVIPVAERQRYIGLLASWQLSLGRPQRGQPLVIENKAFEEFLAFCGCCIAESGKLVLEAKELQQKRPNR